MPGPRRKPRANNAPSATQQAQQLAASRRLQVTESFSGTLPHPDILRQYEEVLPGLADRVITMAEKQANHRIQIEAYTVKADARRANWGIAAGFVVFLAFVAGSVFHIDRGHSNEGLVVGLTPLAAMVGTFVYGTISRRREREHRLEALTGSDRS